MNRVDRIKPRLADEPPVHIPDNMKLTVPEFLSRGQLGEIRQAVDHVNTAGSFTDTAVDVSALLDLSRAALTMAIEKIEGGLS